MENNSEYLVECVRNFLEESRLSRYWKKRMESRSKNARREPKNEIDKEWAKIQQEKSRRINNKIHKIFEKELEVTEELSEEIENFMERVRIRREEIRKKLEEKARLIPLNKNRPKTKLKPPPTNDQIKSKGVAAGYREKIKKTKSAGVAPGESFGGLAEGNEKDFESLTGIQKENFFKLIGDTEEYDILKSKQKQKQKNILVYFNLQLEDAVELIKKCPVLSKPIKRLVTAGTKGFIYLLDNDHILKLFQDDYSGGGDMDWYRTTKTKMFTSKGNITDLPIYDEGAIRLDDGEVVNYVEMARVIPLSDFMEDTRRSAVDAEQEYDLCKAIMSSIESKYGSKFIDLSLEKFVNVFKHTIQKHNMQSSTFTDQEYVNLAKTIFLFAKSGNYLHDSHVGNIGILPQSNPANPVFVIFDN